MTGLGPQEHWGSAHPPQSITNLHDQQRSVIECSSIQMCSEDFRNSLSFRDSLNVSSFSDDKELMGKLPTSSSPCPLRDQAVFRQRIWDRRERRVINGFKDKKAQTTHLVAIRSTPEALGSRTLVLRKLFETETVIH